MKLKCLMTSINASFDQFVEKMEDHDAVAQNLITDIRKAAAQVRIEARAAKNHQNHLEHQKSQLIAEATQWKARALACTRSGDDEKAKECLKLLNSKQAECDQLEQSIAKQAVHVENLDGQVSRIETQLNELVAKRAQMLSREASGRVSTAIQSRREDDSVFERWEKELMVKEYSTQEIPSHADTLAREFERQEADAQIEDALKALKAEVKAEENPNDAS